MGSRGLSANWRDGTIHSRTYHGVGTHYRPPDAHQAQEVYAIPSSHYLLSPGYRSYRSYRCIIGFIGALSGHYRTR